MAARFHGTGRTTLDIDICPATTEENLVALSTALTQLGARLRVEGDPYGVAFPAHPDTLRQVGTMTLITEHGPLDLCFAPEGFAHGYEDLHPSALRVVVEAVEIPVASLMDVVTSKRAAGRPKDIVALPALEAHLRRP